MQKQPACFFSPVNTQQCCHNNHGQRDVKEAKREYSLTDFLLYVLAAICQPELLLAGRVFVHEMRNQDGLQQTEQHQSKNHNAVGRWVEETVDIYFLFLCLVLLTV